jgi:leucyl aminopeptidase (aminopeptidase T)
MNDLSTAIPPDTACCGSFLFDSQNARNVAEFTIGTNPKARLTRNLAEDKKLLGTVHFAIGDNKSLGRTAEATVHLYGLMLKPTVIADNKKVLVENGELMV